MTRCSLRRTKKRRGAALLEFSVTLPLMMLMAVATVDFARVTYYGLVVADAAGAASRYAALNPLTETAESGWLEGLEQSAKAATIGSPWVDSSDLIVHPPVVEQITPVEKRITVKIEYPFVVRFWWPGIPTNPTVVSQVSVVASE
jgi:hypothetical protein